VPQDSLDGFVVNAKRVKVCCESAPEGVPAMPRRNRSDHTPGEVVEIQRLAVPRLENWQGILCQDSRAESVRFERIGQLLDYRDGSAALARFWFAHRAIPHAPRYAQFLAVEVFPSKSAKFALAKSSQGRTKYNRPGRLLKHGEHGLNLGEAVSVGVLFRFWHAGNRNIHDGVDTVEDS
jgi:hypothetical protein